uniref:Uncharacterized protein n=1 Tax=Glossina palpalis gambiensis TaxID=67801 RepID=A0A1B0BUF9_9MUSC
MSSEPTKAALTVELPKFTELLISKIFAGAPMILWSIFGAFLYTRQLFNKIFESILRSFVYRSYRLEGLRVMGPNHERGVLLALLRTPFPKSPLALAFGDVVNPLSDGRVGEQLPAKCVVDSLGSVNEVANLLAFTAGSSLSTDNSSFVSTDEGIFKLNVSSSSSSSIL